MAGTIYEFGSGTLIALPNAGNTAANPTPRAFGTLQDVTIEISHTTKMLFGQNQYPEAVARAEGKITGKAKFGRFNGALINDIFFGQTLATGTTLFALLEAHTIPASPYQVTIAPPSSGVFKSDEGVFYSSSAIPFTKVASAPAVGQYSVNEATGVYTFAAADTTVAVLISYSYTVTTGVTTTVKNQLMGYAPQFRLDLFQSFQTNQVNMRLFACIGSKLTRATKNTEFTVPEFDFEAFADASNNVVEFYDPL